MGSGSAEDGVVERLVFPEGWATHFLLWEMNGAEEDEDEDCAGFGFSVDEFGGMRVLFFPFPFPLEDALEEVCAGAAGGSREEELDVDAEE